MKNYLFVLLFILSAHLLSAQGNEGRSPAVEKGGNGEKGGSSGGNKGSNDAMGNNAPAVSNIPGGEKIDFNGGKGDGSKGGGGGNNGKGGGSGNNVGKGGGNEKGGASGAKADPGGNSGGNPGNRGPATANNKAGKTSVSKKQVAEVKELLKSYQSGPQLLPGMKKALLDQLELMRLKADKEKRNADAKYVGGVITDVQNGKPIQEIIDKPIQVLSSPKPNVKIKPS